MNSMWIFSFISMSYNSGLQPFSRHLYQSEEIKKKKKNLETLLIYSWQSYAKSTIKKTLFPLRYPELPYSRTWKSIKGFVFSLHVFWGIRKELWVLRGWIFRTMRSSMAYNHQYGPVRIHLLWYSKEGNTVIGNQISQIILQVEAKV